MCPVTWVLGNSSQVDNQEQPYCNIMQPSVKKSLPRMDIFGVGGQRFQSSEMRLLLSYFVYIANDVSFFQSAYDSGLIIPATRQLPDCLILAMFSGVSSVLCPLSGAASLSCQEGLLYCSARHGLCCFMTFQSESMIEISICFRRELTAGLALKSVTRSLKRIDLSTHGWKGS